jgi:hypothetical protein
MKTLTVEKSCTMKLSCLAKWWFTTILIFHEQGDTYANQISERVLNSVEIKKIMGKLTFLNPEFCSFDSNSYYLAVL